MISERQGMVTSTKHEAPKSSAISRDLAIHVILKRKNVLTEANFWGAALSRRTAPDM